MKERKGTHIKFLMSFLMLSSLFLASISTGLTSNSNSSISQNITAVDQSKHEQDTNGCNTCNSSISDTSTPQKHPIMPKDVWIQRNAAIKNLPKAGANTVLRAVAYPSSMDLLNYIPSYNARDQGKCGNCWVWGCTAPIEVAHNVQNGINDRLSIQFLNSNYNGGHVYRYACCGGYEVLFQDFYSTQGKFIPWSNTNADYRDGTQICSFQGTSVPASSISTTPSYPITSIQWHQIQTAGVGRDQAISNIKSYLNAKKAVTLGFYLPDFTPFWSFWGSDYGIWDPDQYCGQADGQSPGGHEVTIVGYDDSDPSNRYWIALNSWGTSTAHPDGTFKIKEDMNYDCSNSGYYSYDFGYFDVIFNLNNPPANPSIPMGSPSGKAKKSYSYSTSSTDPNNDQVKYTFNWGDGTTSTTGFADSGVTTSGSHAWRKAGTYLVKAMATDSKGATSGWSDPLSVTMT